jgi:hypothetical protein
MVRPRCSVGVRLVDTVLFSTSYLKLTRAREYQKALSGARTASRTSGRLAWEYRSMLLSFAYLAFAAVLKRSGSSFRVRQGFGTRAAAAPALGLGASASISEASARRSRVYGCARSSAAASAPAWVRGDTGDTAALASRPRAQEVDLPAAPARASFDRPGAARAGAAARAREPAVGL